MCHRLVLLGCQTPARCNCRGAQRRGRRLSVREIKLIRHLHAQFQTALGRLRSLERERVVRVALEQFMRRVPLPTILLRWTLRMVYRNQAAREFCTVWQWGSSDARFIKLKAPLPPEILNQCRVLKKRWEQLTLLGIASVNFKDETVRHPTRRGLRATISLKQINSAAVARPQFLIEFEDLRESGATRHQTGGASLSHLVRLTSREQNWRVWCAMGRAIRRLPMKWVES